MGCVTSVNGRKLRYLHKSHNNYIIQSALTKIPRRLIKARGLNVLVFKHKKIQGGPPKTLSPFFFICIQTLGQVNFVSEKDIQVGTFCSCNINIKAAVSLVLAILNCTRNQGTHHFKAL